MTKTKVDDRRARFGICYDLDRDPQTIHEGVQFENAARRERRRTVAVIPMPFHSAKQKKLVRDFVKTLFPQPLETAPASNDLVETITDGRGGTITYTNMPYPSAAKIRRLPKNTPMEYIKRGKKVPAGRYRT